MKQKPKRKHIPGKRKHQIILVVISTLMLLLMRFPIYFLGDFYRYTGLLYIVLAFATVSYLTWTILEKQVKWLAIFATIITFVSISSNINTFSRITLHDECEQLSPLIIGCGFIYQGDTMIFRHSHARYLTIVQIPIGIQTYRIIWDNFVLF